jgi:hypothetical protein
MIKRLVTYEGALIHLTLEGRFCQTGEGPATPEEGLVGFKV